MNKIEMLRKLNKPAFLVLIVYPLFLLALLTYYAFHYSLTMQALILAIIGYYGSNIAVGIGLHRLWSHNSYKVHPFVETILAIVSAATLQGPILAWASDHHRHHTFTDKERDPHSPKRFSNPVLGFLWSHIGWMLFEKTPKHIEKITLVKLGRNKIVKWQLDYYWWIAIIMNTLVPMFIGYCIEPSWQSVFTAYLFIGLGRALQQECTFFVNSACHFWGRRPYAKGTARDIWWLAMVLLGENWHNFHHAFPSDYRNGHKWYHFDVHKWIIAGLEKIGLAHNLDRTEKIRIAARVQDKRSQDIQNRLSKLQELVQKIDVLKSYIRQMPSPEQMAKSLKESTHKNLLAWEKKLDAWKAKTHAVTLRVEKKAMERKLNRFQKKVDSLETKIQAFLQNWEKKQLSQ